MPYKRNCFNIVPNANKTGDTEPRCVFVLAKQKAKDAQQTRHLTPFGWFENWRI